MDGVSEGGKEMYDESEEIIQKIIKDKLKITKNIIIERAHRTGRKEEGKKRCIVLKLLNYKDKELILKNANKLKGTGVFINEDFSRETLEKRKDLWEKVKVARSQGKFATINYNKSIIKEFKRK